MTFIRFLNMVKAHWYQSILLAVLMGVCALCVREKGVKGLLRSVNAEHAALYLYLAFLLMTAVFGRERVVDPLGNVFENFWPIDWEEEENILAFIPLGFLFPYAYQDGHPLRKTILFSLYVSAFIELSQLIASLGAFQFSDLLYNTVGGAIGGGIYALIACVCRKLKQLRTGRSDKDQPEET